MVETSTPQRPTRYRAAVPLEARGAAASVACLRTPDRGEKYPISAYDNGHSRAYATGGTDFIYISGMEIRGDVLLSGNGGDRIEPDASRVRGSAAVIGAHVSSYIQLLGTTIDLTLSCTGNTPPCNEGSLNTVGGVKSGQCAGL